MKQEKITQNINYVEIYHFTEVSDGFLFIGNNGVIYYMKYLGKGDEIVSKDAMKKWMDNAAGKKNKTLYFDVEENVFVFRLKDNCQLSQSKVCAFEIDKETADSILSDYAKEIESLYQDESFGKLKVYK